MMTIRWQPTDGQISFLNTISPVGTKFKKALELGPQSVQDIVVCTSQNTPLTGKLYIKFITE